MFKVTDEYEVKTVYAARKTESGATEFLVCGNDKYDPWYWISATYYKPVEEESND